MVFDPIVVIDEDVAPADVDGDVESPIIADELVALSWPIARFGAWVLDAECLAAKEDEDASCSWFEFNAQCHRMRS
jgi:hypothetical protein